MADWQATATTIHCDAVDDEVTIIVYPDWSTKCTGLEKYTTSREASLDLLRRSLTLQLALDCKADDCARIPEYVDKLKSEKARRGSSKD